MIYLLIRDNHGEREVEWKIGEPPVTNAEKVWGIQGDQRGLNLIRSTIPERNGELDVRSWFGSDAKKISILIGAAR
jgi:hypothetical protein